MEDLGRALVMEVKTRVIRFHSGGKSTIFYKIILRLRHFA
jgi:hypothetical protein